MSTALKEYEPETAITLTKEVRFNSDLTFGERIFLAELQAMTKEGKQPFSVKKLSEMFQVSHITITNWVKKLVKLGYLDIGIDYTNEDVKKYFITK